MHNFKVLLFGFIISALGTSVTSFSLSLWVISKTQSSFTFAVLLTASALPTLLAAPVLGKTVDKVDKLKLMALCHGVCILGCIVLILLFLSNTITTITLVLLSMMMSMASALHGLAFVAKIPEIIETHQLGSAQSLRSVFGTLSTILAPIIGGIMMLQLNIIAVLIIDLFSFLFALITLIVTIRMSSAVSKNSQAATLPSAPILSLLKSNHFLRITCIQSLLVNLVSSSLLVVLPFYLLSGFSYSSFIIISVLGATGSFLGGITIGEISKRGVDALVVMGWCTLAMAIAYIMLASPYIWLLALGMMLLSIAVSLFNGMAIVTIQQETTPQYRGQMFAYQGMSAQLSSIIAMPLYGWLMDREGITPLLTELSPLSSDARIVNTSYIPIAQQALVIVAGATFAIWCIFQVMTKTFRQTISTTGE